jgi:phenylpyruvate tautomerase PptA (4-oxalocrotonate tautomerase family)
MMPLVKVHYSNVLTKDILNSLSKSLSKLVGKTLVKSEGFVMVIFQQTELQSFGLDSTTPSLFIELKNVGTPSPEITNILSAKITELCIGLINVEPSRIYLEFQESERHLWGWSGKTFST